MTCSPPPAAPRTSARSANVGRGRAGEPGSVSGGRYADQPAGQPAVHLLAPDGQPLTVRQVKQFIHEQCVQQGLEQPGGDIFALGADAGVGHNQGNPDDVLELGVAIVFDFFPRPVGGGYFHDMTRTWCLGYAPAEVERATSGARLSSSWSWQTLEVGKRTAAYQAMTCEYYKSLDYPTILSEPARRWATSMAWPTGWAWRCTRRQASTRRGQHGDAPARLSLHGRAGPLLSRARLRRAHRGRGLLR